MKDGAVYEDMMDFKTLKKYMEDQLEDYNMEPGVIAMDLVLFRDAIEHGTVNDHIFYFVYHERSFCPWRYRSYFEEGGGGERSTYFKLKIAQCTWR